MTKQDFLIRLRKELSGLPKEEIEDRLAFYSEMIDDRVEEGMTEEAAVEGIGSIDEIVLQILSELPIGKLIKERMRPKRALQAKDVALIALGFPIWFPMLLVAAAIILSLYVVLFSVLISLWGVEISLWACAIGGPVMALMYALQGSGLSAGAMLAVGLCSAGVSIFAFYGCIAATKGIIHVSKKLLVAIKKLFVRKENEK